VQCLEHFGVRQWRAVLVAGLVVEIEPEMTARRQLRFAAFKIAEPQFRPLQIGEDADRPPDFLFDRTDFFEARAVLVMRAVAEIEAEHIDARLEQRAQSVGARACRPDRGDNLDAAHPAQRLVAAAPALGGAAAARR
jgi:hypothetical protein